MEVVKKRIIELQNETVRLLSSSQVITSIHSVIKELVENALDAQASSISIRMENYGLDLIEVKDNGIGVSSEDAKLIALPHSTSKITSFADLCTLETYGFRGEALHSVAAMASLFVITRMEGEEIARKYAFSNSGEVNVVVPSAQEKGTTIMVTNLFKHFPVRRQYYTNVKYCKEELKKVENYLLAYGISHPEVRFQLRHNKLSLWQKPVVSNFDANLKNILGPDCIGRMSSVNYQCFNPMIKIQGLVPRPHADISGLTRSTADRMFLLINKRPVQIKTLLQLLKKAFVEAFPSLGPRYPMAVLNISVLPEALDVNVEPNKTSVFLHNLDYIAATLESLLQQIYAPCKVPCEEAPIPRPSNTNKHGGRDEDGSIVVAEQILEGSSNEARKGITNVVIDNTADSESLSLQESVGSACDELTSEELDKEVAEAMPSSLSVLATDCSQTPSFQTSLSQWSRGISYEGQCKQTLQLCQPATTSSQRTLQPFQSKLTLKGPSPVFDMINSRPVKRKSTTPSPIVSKKQIPSSCSSGTSKDLGMCTADCQVDFDLNGVRRRCIAKASGDHSSFTTSKTPEDRVIGWCQLNEGSEMGVWLVVRDTTISCFSISRDDEREGKTTKSEVQVLFENSMKQSNMFHSLHKLKSGLESIDCFK